MCVGLLHTVCVQAAVVRGLRPTPEQRAACVAALDLYRERMGPALQERKSLAHQMSAALAQAEGQRNAATAAAVGAETGQPTHQVLGRLGGWSPDGVPGANDSASGCSSSGGGGCSSGGKDVTLEFMSAAQSLQRNVATETHCMGVVYVSVGQAEREAALRTRVSAVRGACNCACTSTGTAQFSLLVPRSFPSRPLLVHIASS